MIVIYDIYFYDKVFNLNFITGNIITKLKLIRCKLYVMFDSLINFLRQLKMTCIIKTFFCNLKNLNFFYTFDY